jgi:hypothetical protein
MKTSSNTPPRHIITCVQFNGALVQQHYRKTKSSPICTCFLDTEITLTQWKCHIATVYLKKTGFLSKKVTCELELQPSNVLFVVTYIY